MGIKELILKKGWAGRTISRAETVERLNPIIHFMSGVLLQYTSSLEFVDNPQIRTMRMDIGKLSETIASCGGVPARHSGDGDSDGDSGSGDAPENIRSAELDLRELLLNERKIEHQMRTRAILGVVLTNTEARIGATA
jgi:hypothetical protein